MATLIKKTAVVCKDAYEFRTLTKLTHKVDLDEYYHITSLELLKMLDDVAAVVYLKSAKELDDFSAIVEEVHNRGVSQKWQ